MEKVIKVFNCNRCEKEMLYKYDVVVFIFDHVNQKNYYSCFCEKCFQEVIKTKAKPLTYENENVFTIK